MDGFKSVTAKCHVALSRHPSRMVHALHRGKPHGCGLTATLRLGLTGRETRQVDPGVLVAVMPGTAFRAVPGSVREGQGGVHVTACRTGLARREPAVGDPEFAAVPLALVGQLPPELSKG